MRGGDTGRASGWRRRDAALDPQPLLTFRDAGQNGVGQHSPADLFVVVAGLDFLSRARRVKGEGAGGLNSSAATGTATAQAQQLSRAQRQAAGWPVSSRLACFSPPIFPRRSYRKPLWHLIQLAVQPLVLRLPALVPALVALLLLHLLFNVLEPGGRGARVGRAGVRWVTWTRRRKAGGMDTTPQRCAPQRTRRAASTHISASWSRLPVSAAKVLVMPLYTRSSSLSLRAGGWSARQQRQSAKGPLAPCAQRGGAHRSRSRSRAARCPGMMPPRSSDHASCRTGRAGGRWVGDEAPGRAMDREKQQHAGHTASALALMAVSLPRISPTVLEGGRGRRMRRCVDCVREVRERGGGGEAPLRGCIPDALGALAQLLLLLGLGKAVPVGGDGREGEREGRIAAGARSLPFSRLPRCGTCVRVCVACVCVCVRVCACVCVCVCACVR